MLEKVYEAQKRMLQIASVGDSMSDMVSVASSKRSGIANVADSKCWGQHLKRDSKCWR